MKKSRIRKYAACGLVAMMATTVLGGNTNAIAGSNDEVTITFSLWDEIQSVVYQQLIDNFEEQNPGIHVEMQLTPWDQYWTKFDAAAGAAQAADTFFMNVWVPKYAEAGVLEPLDSYFEEDGVDLSLYSESVLENGTYNGVRYTVPKGTDSLAVIVNAGLFEKYGVDLPTDDWTWDDMVEICRELKENIAGAGDSIYPMAFMLDSSNGSWQPVISEFGGEVFNEDGMSGYSEEGSIAGIQALVDMISEGLIPDYQMISDTSAEEFFISGQACMLYLPTFSSQKVEQAEMENVVLVRIPLAKTRNFIAGNMHIGMNAKSEHKDEAWKFMSYLMSEEAQDLLGQTGIDCPAMISSQKYYAESFKQFDGTAFVTGLEDALAYTPAPSYAEDAITAIENEEIIPIFTQEVSVEDGMNQMAEDINAELEG